VRHQTLGILRQTWRHVKTPCVSHIVQHEFLAHPKEPQLPVISRPAPAAAGILDVHVALALALSANDELPDLSVAVALCCMQLRCTELFGVKMCAGIDERLYVISQPCCRSQEKRGVA
jgi:hypothetical protein